MGLDPIAVYQQHILLMCRIFNNTSHGAWASEVYSKWVGPRLVVDYGDGRAIDLKEPISVVPVVSRRIIHPGQCP